MPRASSPGSNPWATLSNCGDFLKLIATVSALKRVRHTRGNALGMVRTLLDITMDDPQPTPTGLSRPKDAVQRLDGSGPPGLRYSLSPAERRV